jgi:predicted transcriptional regulator
MEGKKASEVMSSPVTSIQSNSSLRDCINMLKKSGISQLPVYSGTKLVGSMTENRIVTLLESAEDPGVVLSKQVSLFMLPSFPIVSMDTPVEALFSLFKFVSAVLVGTGDKPEGIITKIDMLSAEVR